MEPESILFVWFLSLSIIILKFIHVVAQINNSFISEEYSTIQIYHNVCVYLPDDRHWVVSSFWVLQIQPLPTFVYEFLCRQISFPLGKYRHAEWLGPGRGVCLSILRKHPAAFWGGSTILYSHQQPTNVLVALHSCQHLVLCAIIFYFIPILYLWFYILS